MLDVRGKYNSTGYNLTELNDRKIHNYIVGVTIGCDGISSSGESRED